MYACKSPRCIVARRHTSHARATSWKIYISVSLEKTLKEGVLFFSIHCKWCPAKHWKGTVLYVQYNVKQIQYHRMTTRMAFKMSRNEERIKTVAVQYLADLTIMTGLCFPQVRGQNKKRNLIYVSTHSPRLSHRCFVGNVAGFLTWTTVWRGQPGGDPHLQLWLLRQQPPDFTNHTPAGGERENVWQLFTRGRRRGRRGENEIFFFKKGGMERIKKDKRKGRETTVSVLGRWEEQYDQSCVIRGYGWSSVPLFMKPFSKSQSIWVDKNDFVCFYKIP